MQPFQPPFFDAFAKLDLPTFHPHSFHIPSRFKISRLENIAIRHLASTDSLEDLTDLLHRAYKVLADMGFRFTATYQDAATTRERCEHGETFVAERDRAVVGTVTFYPVGKNRGCPWYERPGVSSFGQFAVEPALQKTGIGAALMDAVERRAAETGADEIALDTAEGAHHLIAYYERRGYRHVGHADWHSTNYRSVILSKKLHAPSAAIRE
jgi:predicted N-acetyltransferase YhbS